MKRPVTSGRQAPRGPSQRQLRAGELMRHALVEILMAQEITDPDIAGVSITLTEVRMSPDRATPRSSSSPWAAASRPGPWSRR